VAKTIRGYIYPQGLRYSVGKNILRPIKDINTNTARWLRIRLIIDTMENELFANNEKEEYILCAAIWLKSDEKHEHQPRNIDSGVVVCGRRHHNCFITAWALCDDKSKYSEKKGNVVQGFLTSKNRFVDRKEAAIIAVANGQSCRETDLLFSEDLY